MLKDTLINQGTLYLGRHAGKEIHEKIKAAQHSIKVITPYISNEYIDLLKGKAQKGLDVKLIVSSDIGGKKDRYEPLKKLISQEKHTDVELKEKRQKYIGYVNSAFILSILITGLGIYYKMQFTWYVLPIFPILFFTRKKWVSLPIYTYTYYSDLSLSIPMSPYTNGFESQHTLVHAKLFIIDEELAYVGSVNFTKAAFFYNYESRIKLTQKDIVVKLSQEFSYVYSNKNTEYLNISDMVKRIYSEPQN